jgi:hypothetical protein
MVLLKELFVVLHFLGMGALFGGAVANLTKKSQEVSSLVLWGARAQLITGLIITGLVEGIGEDELDMSKIGIKLLISLTIAALAEIGSRKKGSPWLTWIVVLTVVNVCVAALL